MEGFVLGGVDTGEAHRYLSLYVRELGLVRAIAKGVRQERSRLRYDLSDFSYGQFRLVRGKEVWRITGANCLSNAYARIATDRDKVFILGNVFALVRRLVVGEEAHGALFDEIRAGIHFLSESTFEGDDFSNFEHVFVLRILHLLGYVKNEPQFVPLLEGAAFDQSRSVPSLLRRQVAAEINRALAESHL